MKSVKKIIKRMLKVAAWVLGILLALLVVSGIVNAIATSFDIKSLRSAYGRSVLIDGGNVHVDVQGTGKKVVVLLPGLGVSAPMLDFKPLINNLKDDYTVVTYEGFGYGPSDDTTKPRTTDNIVSEIHQTLSKLGYSEYSIIAHSVSGIYALKYCRTYPNEVEAIVGIDSSVPRQTDYMPDELKKQQPDVKLITSLIRFGGLLGFVRAYVTIDPGSTTAFEKNGYSYTDQEKDLINKLTIRNFSSNAVLDETNRSDNQDDGLLSTTQFPEQIPVKLFLAQQSVDMFPKWKDIHTGQISLPNDTSVVILKGDHFLYHTQAEAIANSLRTMIAPVR